MNKAAIVFILLLLLFAKIAFAQYPQKSKDGKFSLNLDENGCMAQGYDVVELYNNLENKGKSTIASEYQGGKYWFINITNKQTFDANPSKYAPLYGGFCAFAITEGNLRPIQIWTHKVTNGHLVLQHSATALKLWNKKEQKNYKKAEHKWQNINELPAVYNMTNGEDLESLRKTSYGKKPND